MELQAFLQNVADTSFNRVQSGLKSFNNATPFTGTPFTVLHRESLGAKTFTANELYGNRPMPNTENIKEVKSFTKSLLPTHIFVSMEAATGGYELVAVNKQTGFASERLLRNFPSYDAASQYVNDLHTANTRSTKNSTANA